MKNRMTVLIGCLVAAVFSLVVLACEDDDESNNTGQDTGDPTTPTDSEDTETTDTDTETSDVVDTDDTPTDVDDEFSVSGIVKRMNTAKLKAGGDGIGSICVAITVSCPNKQNTDPEVLGEGLTIKDADLTTGGAEVPFTITIPTAEAEMDKRYFVSAVFKEDNSDCVQPPEGEPVLKAGDMVATFGCGKFRFKGEDVEGIKLRLDWTLEQDYF